jgi:hypothetical protein
MTKKNIARFVDNRDLLLMIMRRRRNVKQAIELLKDTLISLGWATSGNLVAAQNAYNQVKRALEILNAPRWETPEKWEKRTGEPWPDNAPVWVMYDTYYYREPWYLDLYEYAKEKREKCEEKNWPHNIVCATEAGPPPDFWEPEEEKEKTR